jgi:Uma2 family endonuclease
MTLATPPTPAAAQSLVNSMRRFSVDEYHQLLAIGMLAEDERVELLEGWIVQKMTHNPIHDTTVDRLAELLRDRVARSFRIRIQSAITTADSEPEPDVVIAHGPAERYNQRHPSAADIELLVEVADTSLDRDRNIKAAVYANAGIKVYWIVNLPRSEVEVYTNPAGSKYQKADHFDMNASIPLNISGQSLPPIPVKEILP